jgi:predicted dinucleotide-binding enzyme
MAKWLFRCKGERAMQIAIIGAGHVGAALGKGWARAGHEIIFGVRDPGAERHAEPARSAGNACILTARAAAAAAPAIVLAVMWGAAQEALASCGDLSGRLLIDPTNPLRMGAAGLELALGFDRSGGETVAEWAPGASVFKTLNQVGFEVMAETTGYPVPPTMFVAGDDEVRKPTVLQLVSELGFQALDAGPLRMSRLLEPYAMLWIHMAMVKRMPTSNAFALLEHATPRSRAAE